MPPEDMLRLIVGMDMLLLYDWPIGSVPGRYPFSELGEASSRGPSWSSPS